MFSVKSLREATAALERQAHGAKCQVTSGK
jgi:hypothetical protein